MLRPSLIAIALALSASLAALETPLVIHQPNGTLTAVVNAALGTVTLYEVQGQQLTRYSSVSFLNDLNFLDSYMHTTDKDGHPHSALRDGFNNKIGTEDLLKWYDTIKQSKTEKDKDVLPYGERARNSENDFWSEDHPYDGVVRGALGTRMLFLVIPCKHAILVYEVASNRMTLAAYRNYGAELYMPQVYNSVPTPAGILASLPKDIQDDRKKALEAQMEDPGSDAGKTIPIQKSDIWIGAGAASGFDRFAIIDFANQHIMSYEFSGKALELKSVRNLEIDLLIPSGLNSAPEPKQMFDQFRGDRERQAFMKKMGYEPDLAMLEALVNSQGKAGGDTSKYQANVRGEDITVDFTESHKLFVYRLQGANNNLELVSARDYTVDVAIALFDNERADQIHAQTIYDGIKNAVQARQIPSAMLMLKTALKLDPGLYKDAEKDLSRSLGKEADWQKLIEDATKAYDEQQKLIEARKKAAADERERRNKARSGNR